MVREWWASWLTDEQQQQAASLGLRAAGSAYQIVQNVFGSVFALLGLLILLLSISLLIWGLLPARHEIRTLPISPSDLQLPTPSSFYFDAPGEFHAGRFNASLIKLVEGS